MGKTTPLGTRAALGVEWVNLRWVCLTYSEECLRDASSPPNSIWLVDSLFCLFLLLSSFVERYTVRVRADSRGLAVLR